MMVEERLLPPRPPLFWLASDPEAERPSGSGVAEVLRLRPNADGSMIVVDQLLLRPPQAGRDLCATV